MNPEDHRVPGDAGVGAPPARPFRLATFFDGEPADGGGYVHQVGVLPVLRRLQDAGLEVLVICRDKAGLETVRAAGLDGVLQRRHLVTRLLGRVSALDIFRTRRSTLIGALLSPVDRLLERLRADLVYFAGPDPRALQLFTREYVFSVWDLCHVEYPDFPEISGHGEFARRERLYRRALPRAAAIIADSVHTRNLIETTYSLPAARVQVAPFLMGSRIGDFSPDTVTAEDVKARYGLTEPYIFYPAQFWPHKNHRYILEALKVMLARYQRAPQAVFCGSDQGSLAATLEHARRLGVEELINYCGFVPDGDLPYLYQGAIALVMPTYFGPSNLPPLEALELGVPVCYSDLPSFREQFGDSVHYVDLENPGSLAEAVQALWNADWRGRAASRRSGRESAAMAEERYLAVLRRILTTYQQLSPDRE